MGTTPAVIPIFVKVWAGPEQTDKRFSRYIRRCLPSLLASDLPAEARVVFADDCSPHAQLAPFLADLAKRDPRVEVWTNPHWMGLNQSQEYNFPRLVERYPDAEFFLLLDDDFIYHPGWLQRLIRVYREGRAAGHVGLYSAINLRTREGYDRVKLPTCEVLVKRRQGGGMWLLPRDIYDTVGPFRETDLSFDSDYFNRAEPLGFPIYCMTPSYVQHVGYQGTFALSPRDSAADYVGDLGWYFRAHHASCTLKVAAREVKRVGFCAARRLRRWAGLPCRPYPPQAGTPSS